MSKRLISLMSSSSSILERPENTIMASRSTSADLGRGEEGVGGGGGGGGGGEGKNEKEREREVLRQLCFVRREKEKGKEQEDAWRMHVGHEATRVRCEQHNRWVCGAGRAVDICKRNNDDQNHHQHTYSSLVLFHTTRM